MAEKASARKQALGCDGTPVCVSQAHIKSAWLYIMRVLDLFSGMGCVGNVCRASGMDAIALGRGMPADIRCDIMDWDCAAYEPKSFDFIWAAPPCTEYSIAKTTGVRHIELASRVSQRTIDIIIYLDPKYWVIENPQTGKLKDQDFMNGLPFNDIDYCKYGMPYRKRTRLWNNIDCWQSRPLCKRGCDTMHDDNQRRTRTAQRAPPPSRERRSFRQRDLYKVPEPLITEIEASIDHNVGGSHIL